LPLTRHAIAKATADQERRSGPSGCAPRASHAEVGSTICRRRESKERDTRLGMRRKRLKSPSRLDTVLNLNPSWALDLSRHEPWTSSSYSQTNHGRFKLWDEVPKEMKDNTRPGASPRPKSGRAQPRRRVGSLGARAVYDGSRRSTQDRASYAAANGQRRAQGDYRTSSRRHFMNKCSEAAREDNKFSALHGAIWAGGLDSSTSRRAEDRTAPAFDTSDGRRQRAAHLRAHD